MPQPWEEALSSEELEKRKKAREVKKPGLMDRAKAAIVPPPPTAKRLPKPKPVPTGFADAAMKEAELREKVNKGVNQTTKGLRKWASGTEE